MAKQLSFYRPHKRVTFDNVAADPKTGELKPVPSMTKQEFKTECDINNVVKQFKPHHMNQMLAANLASGMYTDLPDDIDYQAALDTVKAAEASFLTVPAMVRAKFGQDPTAFLAFIHDPANAAEARSLGLLKPEPEPVKPVEVVIKGDAAVPASQPKPGSPEPQK